MNKDDLINELIVSGSNKWEAFDLAKFAETLNPTILERNHAFKLGQFETIASKLERKKFSWRRVVVPLGLGLGSLSLLAGTIFAAQGSLPGEPLYPVKRISEQVISSVYPKFAENLPVRRTQEIKQLIEQNKDGTLLKNNLEDYTKEITKNKPSSKVIEQSRDNLQQAEEKASGTAKTEIQNVLEQGSVKGETKAPDSNVESSSGQRNQEKSRSSDSSRKQD